MEKITLAELLTLDITGKVICFPTDTVYGVGARITDSDAISKIYRLKHRNPAKPLAILTATKDISEYVERITADAKTLMEKHWPGPLTLIFKRSDVIDEQIVRGAKTIAFRMPNSQIALAILKTFGPMATTSVNLAGAEPLNSVEEIADVFSDYIDYIVTDQENLSKKPSSVLDVSEEVIKVIR